VNIILRLGPRKQIDRPPRNKITTILLSILWGVSGFIIWILDYRDIIDVTDVIRLPIGFVILIFLVLGFFAIYTLYSIYKLVKEIRNIARSKNIVTAEEVFEKKYGDEFEIQKSPILVQLVDNLEKIGAVKIVQTHRYMPKVEFFFPPDHKFDSYQKITMIIEKENEIKLNAEIKYEFPSFFSIRKREQKETGKKRRKAKEIQPFFERYQVTSDDEKFTKKILDETLIDEVVSEKEAHLEQISVHGKTLTATLSKIDSVELFFILLSTIMDSYTR
jgi:hypothetical protein